MENDRRAAAHGLASITVILFLCATSMVRSQAGQSPSPQDGQSDPGAPPASGVVPEGRLPEGPSCPNGRCDALTVKPPRGFYDAPIAIRIAAQKAGAVVHYTLDGSLPTATIGAATRRHEAAIRLDRTGVLRLQAFLDGRPVSPPVTHTYLFLDDVLEQSDAPTYADGTAFPRHWSGFRADYAVDGGVVRREGADTLRSALRAIPTLSLVLPDHVLFQKLMNAGGKRVNRGLERPLSVEFLYPDDPKRSVHINAGLRPRSFRLDHRIIKRNFQILFRKEFGPGKLRFPVFAQAPQNAHSAVERFDHLVLRPGCVDSWQTPDFDHKQATFTRDPMTRDSQLAVSRVGARSDFVHLYLNGLYWGLYNLTEKINEDLLADYFGGKAQDWCVVKSLWNSDTDGDVRNGNPARYRRLLDLVGGHGHGRPRSLRDAAAYTAVTHLIDPVRFAEYIMVHCYHGTGDWPDNNWYFAMRTNPPEAGFFVVWDAEKSLADYKGDGRPGAWYSPLLTDTSGPGGRSVPSRIWQAMITSPKFRDTFAQAVKRHLTGGGALTAENAQRRWLRINERIGYTDRERAAILGEVARWGDTRGQRGSSVGYDQWHAAVTKVHQKLAGNPEVFLREFSGFADVFAKHGVTR